MGADSRLNGDEFKVAADDSVPTLSRVTVGSWNLMFAPASITFVAISNANNLSCRSDRYERRTSNPESSLRSGCVENKRKHRVQGLNIKDLSLH